MAQNIVYFQKGDFKIKKKRFLLRVTIMKTNSKKQVDRTWENLRTKVINRSNLLMRDQNS
jgi:hypothetical protein